MRCKGCKFFKPLEKEWRLDSAPRGAGWGECSRWERGYSGLENYDPRGVYVENDEGWGAIMGPEFGCVLWEAKSEER